MLRPYNCKLLTVNCQLNQTSPANPMKANAKMPAVTSAIGTPFIPFGTSDSVSCSRKPAKTTKAKVKPAPFDKAYIAPSNKPKSFCMTKIATPRTQQFVVMSGRKTPRAAYSEGLIFFKIISTICTNAAMTKMKAMVCRNPKLKGFNR